MAAKRLDLSIYNYSVPCTKFPSEWFDTKKDKKEIKSTLSKMGFETFGVYLSLYRFRIHNQSNEHTFFTSIEELQKHSQQRSVGRNGGVVCSAPLTLEEVTEALIKLVNLEAIEIKNVGKAKIRRSLYDVNGKPKADKFLHIEATTSLSIFGGDDEREEGKPTEYFIYVPFDLLQYYEMVGLNIKHIVMYCYLKKWTNERGYCYKSLDNIGKDLEMDSRTAQRIIKEMNKECVVASHKRATDKKDGSQRFEHYVLDGMDTEKKLKPFIKEHGQLFGEDLYTSLIGRGLGYDLEEYQAAQLKKEIERLSNESKYKKKNERLVYDEKIKKLREQLHLIKPTQETRREIVDTKQVETPYKVKEDVKQIDITQFNDDYPTEQIKSKLPDNPASFF